MTKEEKVAIQSWLATNYGEHAAEDFADEFGAE